MHEAGNTRQMQRRPGHRHRRTRTGAPDRNACRQSAPDRQSGARTERAARRREDTESRSTGDHRTSTGCKPSTKRTRKRRCLEHHGRGTAGADGRVNARGTADAHRAASRQNRRDDQRHRKRGAVAGAAEGHRPTEGKGRRAGCVAARNHVLPARRRERTAGRGCQGVGDGRYGGPLKPVRAALAVSGPLA